MFIQIPPTFGVLHENKCIKDVPIAYTYGRIVP